MSTDDTSDSSPFDTMLLFDLANELKDRAAEGQKLTHEALEKLAVECELELPEAYAALALAQPLELEREEATRIEVCTGRCQFMGGAGLLRALVKKRNERKASKSPGIDICARTCLDDCENAPVLRSSGPSGRFMHVKASVASLDELLDAVTS